MADNKGVLVRELISSVSLALDLEEEVKLYHAWRVAAVAQAMAEKLDPNIRTAVFYAGLLHDVGAIGLEDHVVHFPTKEEQLQVPQIVGHCHRGAVIAASLPGLKDAEQMILDHHEWYDGTGYPGKKRGEEICTGGQILRLADSFDLWLRNNPKATRVEIIEKAKKGIGSEYSQAICEGFTQVIARGSFFHRVTRENSLAFFMRQLENNLDLQLNTGDFSIEQVLTIFAQIIDAKHQYTKGHSERVAQYSYELAKAMGLAEKQCIDAKRAGLLHDAGKLAVSRRILDKPAGLTAEEFSVIKLHPILTMEILELVSELAYLAPFSGYHHERMDGMGYPDGLKGEEIPLLARIMAVADAFDAMTSGRSYQKTKTFAQALEILKKNAGDQFDPQVVESALRIFSDKI